MTGLELMAATAVVSALLGVGWVGVSPDRLAAPARSALWAAARSGAGHTAQSVRKRREAGADGRAARATRRRSMIDGWSIPIGRRRATAAATSRAGRSTRRAGTKGKGKTKGQGRSGTSGGAAPTPPVLHEPPRFPIGRALNSLTDGVQGICRGAGAVAVVGWTGGRAAGGAFRNKWREARDEHERRRKAGEVSTWRDVGRNITDTFRPGGMHPLTTRVRDLGHDLYRRVRPRHDKATGCVWCGRETADWMLPSGECICDGCSRRRDVDVSTLELLGTNERRDGQTAARRVGPWDEAQQKFSAPCCTRGCNRPILGPTSPWCGLCGDALAGGTRNITGDTPGAQATARAQGTRMVVSEPPHLAGLDLGDVQHGIDEGRYSLDPRVDAELAAAGRPATRPTAQTTAPIDAGTNNEGAGMHPGESDTYRDAQRAHPDPSWMRDVTDAYRTGACPRCGGEPPAGRLLCTQCAVAAGIDPEPWPGSSAGQAAGHAAETTPPSGGGTTTTTPKKEGPVPDVDNISALAALTMEMAKAADSINETAKYANISEQLPDSLGYEPGEDIIQLIQTAAELAPDHDQIHGWLEALLALAEALPQREEDLGILAEKKIKGHTDQLTPA